jgi:branched-subunit amino acid transport protein
MAKMSAQWIAVIGTSVCAFGLKFLGHSVPESWLSHPRIQRINSLIPIVLLTALVAVNAVTTKSKIVIDHRVAGLAVAVAALIAKLPFPFIVIGAAVGSAVAYHFGH